MKCPLCGTIKSKSFGKYKFNVQYDKKYIGNPNIEVCTKCNLGFVNPMPSEKKLEDFYTNIYRSTGRPHFEDIKSPPMPRHRHLAYMSNLSLMVDLSQVSTILEIGAGWGETGMLLLEHYPHLNIYTVEPDKHCKDVLIKRGYKVVESFEDIENCSAEVVMSFHCLEHFSSPSSFANIYKDYVSSNATIFIEVPNCRFGEGFEIRPYDSPHMLFFNSESLEKFAELNNLEVLSIYTTGWPIIDMFKGYSNWKNEYNDWVPGNSKKIKIMDIMRVIIPARIKNAIVGLIRDPKPKLITHQSRNLSRNNPNFGSIRCVFRVKG